MNNDQKCNMGQMLHQPLNILELTGSIEIYPYRSPLANTARYASIRARRMAR